MRSSARLAGEVVGDRVGVVRADAEQDDEARPDLADDGSPSTRTRAPGRALEERPHGWLGGGMTPCSRDEGRAPRLGVLLMPGPRRGEALDDDRLGRRRDEQVVVADAVGVHLAVAPEHDDRHALGLDLVREALGEVLRAAR